MPSKKKRYTFTYKGTRHSIFASSEREAGRLIAEKQKIIEEGYDRTRGDMRLRDWAPMCINAYKTRQSDKTRRDFVQLVDRAIIAEIGDLRLSEVSPLDCQTIMNSYAGKSKSSINKLYQALRFLFGQAVTCGNLAKDPTAGLIKPTGTEGKRRALTPEERGAILRVAPEKRTWWVYLLMMLCGCRPGEAAKAKIDDLSDVYATNGELVHLLHIRGTKTKKADRMVPMPESLYQLVKDVPPGEYISVTRRGTKHGQNWGRHFATLKKAANLGDDLVPYCLRHEFGTECARRGLDIRVTMKLMGHESVKMTAEIYTNLERDDILTAASVLQDVHPPVHPTAESVENARLVPDS